MGVPTIAVPSLVHHDRQKVDVPGVLRNLERLFLSSGRALLVVGTVLIISTIGDPGADTVLAFHGFLLFILGVVLVMVSPIASGAVVNAYHALRGLDLQQLFLDVGRVSLLAGWLVVIYSFAKPAANAARVFLGFALLLLGVFLLTFSPVAFRFAEVAWGGATVANAVFNHLFAPGN